MHRPWSDEREEVVRFGYERLSDHIVVRHLLDTYWDENEPQKAFKPKGELRFIVQADEWAPQGFIEALCVQVPERVGREIAEIAPDLRQRSWFGEAFMRSLIWRSPEAFTDSTLEYLNDAIESQSDFDRSLEVLLTVASSPDHPLNADFLHGRLLEDSMPDRDRWWSTYVFRAYDSQSAIDRLTDWAWSPAAKSHISDESVRLCATTLLWFLTTSHRFLRDRATNALVNLLTDRVHLVPGLLKKFSEVDAPYVRERLFAVAYGCVLRSSDLAAICKVAQTAYDQIFEEDPPVHILLRDYARGIVEHALDLNCEIEVDAENIRPPYDSEWPAIPTEEEIKKYDRKGATFHGDEGEWSHQRIYFSVMGDDFARYVIGTDHSSNWLSIPLSEPLWMSNEEKLSSFIDGFSEKKQELWDTFDEARRAYKAASVSITFAAPGEADDDNNSTDGEKTADIELKADTEEKDRLEKGKEDAWEALATKVTDEERQKIRELLELAESDRSREAPTFDLSKAQRWILKRVFELGWTQERFGYFDRYFGHQRRGGRAAKKPERIGKKYQWIAYHEFMALLCDHYQYREGYSEPYRTYEGPWQKYIRDIDPSCVLKEKSGGTSFHSHDESWWGPSSGVSWTEWNDAETWLHHAQDLPNIASFITVQHPEDDTEWINADAFFNWKQPVPPGRESSEIDKKEVWYMINSYLFDATLADEMMEWAEKQNFYGRWMPDPRERYEIFLGEYCWSPAFKHFQKPFYGGGTWIESVRQGVLPTPINITSERYLKENSTFDCSVDEGYTLRAPSCLLRDRMGLNWSGQGANYTNENGRLDAFDPSVATPGPDALLLRRRALEEMLRSGLAVLFTVVGEKQLLTGGMPPRNVRRGIATGAYLMTGDSFRGSLRYGIEEKGTAGKADLEIVQEIRVA